MWKEPEPDPGGDTQEGASSGLSLHELSDLKDQNEQQQLLIAQLKEMLRKEQSNVTQEKVEEYMHTLSKVKAKRTRLKKDDSGVERSVSTSSVDSNKKGKLNLLKQQMEENKARLVERGKSQKGIEEMVTQLKAQLNDSQQLIPTNLADKPRDYSKASSQEELYNVLLTKERQITDLINKSRQQEAAILDLQENLKEKDSVIDARTKAITLMTESLNMKGKTTLDALDDTKEEMRTMQERFVKLEGEMKARQQKLLSDLKGKNFEIADLQESNQKLVEEKTELLKTRKTGRVEGDDTKELLQQLEHSKGENEALLLRISELTNDEEICNLKKTLEETNKRVIKIKAQSKSKIKELTKKIEQFKKASDTNALVVELQTENTKLGEKIAELEEEKGNMQLKMVESTESVKESQLEDGKESEAKLARNVEELAEKDKVISLLELDIISLKEEIKELNDKVSGFLHLENVQVTSAMNSIQIEEQLDNTESKNVALRKEIEVLVQEKEELAEKIEELRREKQEVSAKLDNYIQENMELIDKLEKLSAEKVSSAESIEIVEGLTQQEKLELAAYQKHVDVHMEGEPIKCTEDDTIESPVELNESVLQLSEDSTELLQKIDMFNMERKEVMIKMEALKEENNQLSMKIKEIENNRDILAETYEQLQTEKEMLQNENDELVKKLRTSKEDASVGREDESSRSVALAELQELQIQYGKLLDEHEDLKRTLKGYDDVIHEKHNLESELALARTKIKGLEANIETNIEELNNYQSVIEENRDELINSATLINDLQNKLRARETDVSDLNVLLNDLNVVVNNLQTENAKLGNFELMESQVAELRTALNEQIQQAQDYEEEIARSNDIIDDLNTKLLDMNRKLVETDMKDVEAKQLAQDLQNKDETICNLQRQVEERDKKINVVVQDMKEKYLSLQKQLDGNNGSLETKVTELTNKNKEQLEKMKKLAANLKKKTQAYQELEAKHNVEKEKWETEVNEKEALIAESQNKIGSVLQQLTELEEEVNLKSAQLAEAESKTRELTQVVYELEQSKIELQNYITELKHEEKLNEVSLKQELSTSLHEEFDNIPSNRDSANEEKIKELELIIETNEAELAHHKERVFKLEEDISSLAQEKEAVERNALQLSEQFKLASKNVEEIALLEEELGQKLLQVTANDEVLARKLDELTEENKDLSQKNKELDELTLKLKIKLKKAHEKVTQLKSSQTNMEELESANAELKKQLAALEANQKHIHDENEELQKRNQNDYEKIEADYQIQMEELVKGKNELTVECEKLRETLKEMEGREEELLSEVAEYKQKVELNEAGNQERIGQLTEELRVATYNYEDSTREVQALNKQIAAMQSQLVVKVAKETVEDVLAQAEEKIVLRNTVGSQTEDTVEEKIVQEHVVENTVQLTDVTSETVPTFHWPGNQQGNQDWFADQTQSSSNVPPSDLLPSQGASGEQLNPFYTQPQPLAPENTKEELLNKIKALEFLLYNVDKEKQEALDECSGMVKELTRLVYDKVKPPELEPTAPSTSDVESQIMSSVDVADAAANKKELQRIEFEKSNVALGEQSHPVVEDVVRPKRAYLTYQPEDKPSGAKLEAFGENDDGWGWGPEEAKLEEEHLYKAESTPQAQSLRAEIDRLNERLQVLQVERENHLEEIKQLQIKSGKLIKKCKEFKLKNEQLVQSKKADAGDFFNLDDTIQEELKTQIAQLEKKIKELAAELEKEKAEKTNVLKRVDVLTAANERMLEMKEIQDTEVLRWKRNHQELEDKLKRQEWGSDGFNEGTKQKESDSNDNNQVEELQQTIKELALDNEELQALLDEQRQLRISAERAKSVSDVPREDELVLKLQAKVQGLEQELARTSIELQAVVDERNTIVASNNELQQVVRKDEAIVRELRESLTILTEKNSESEQLLADQSKIVRDLQENEKTATAQKELRDKITELENDLIQLEDAKSQQDRLLNEKDAAYNELLASFNQISALKDDLTLQVAELTQKYEESQAESATQQNKLAELNKLNAKKERKVRDLYSEIQGQAEVIYTMRVDNEEKLKQLALENERLQLEYTTKVSELQSKSADADAFEVATQKQQLENSLAEKERAINELSSEKLELEGELVRLTQNLKEQEREFEALKAETDETIARTAAELAASWAVQVDQRGADVAESWKLHLDTVEADFTAAQEKMRYEINELEEKCNGLVNENNELRKNVDAEIRNEVDRISALQQQITDRQRYITELNNTLIEKQNENESLIGKLTALENEVEQLRVEIANKETRLASLNIVVETTQAQFDEKREVVEEIVRILEKSSSRPLSYEKQDVLSEFQRQLNVVDEKEREVLSLGQLIENLQSQLQALQGKDVEVHNLADDLQKQLVLRQEKDAEVYRLNQEVEVLQTQLSLVDEKDVEISRLNKFVEESQTQLAKLHEMEAEIYNLNKLVDDLQNELATHKEKDGELLRLNQLVGDLQSQIYSLHGKDEEISQLNQVIGNYKVQQDIDQQELAVLIEQQTGANFAIDDYKEKLEEFKVTHVALQNALEEKNQLIATLNQQLQFTESVKNDTNKDVEKLQEEISQLKNDCSILQDSLAECQQQLFSVTNELSTKSSELENVTQQLAYTQQNFEIQEGELVKLREALQVQEQDYSTSIESVRKTQLRDLENHYDEVLSAKDLDIGSVRTQLNESIQISQQLSEQLNVDVGVRQQLEAKVKQLEEKIAEQAALLDEENKQLGEMRSIIEQQVIKIEDMKKELFEKSSDYDSLIAEMDIGRGTITQQPTTSTNTESASSSKSMALSQEDDLSEPVSRAELDLALYMLHQRDVRCEELTVELTQLLEERDTLQLRLSNAIREKEEIRRKIAGTDDIPTPSASSAPSTPHSKSSAIFLAASGTELASETEESSSGLQNLENKLSELRRVGYKKDKTFVDEQELRRMQQISILQQHISEASKLPPEAAAKLVDASYTLSRDVQSPSKVLLNWLWGRSTPKINDT